MYNDHAMMVNLQEQITGLIAEARHGRTISDQAPPYGLIGADGEACPCELVNAHCERSVSQRQLGTPNVWATGDIVVLAAADMYAAAVTAVTGILQAIATSGFNDSNIGVQRARVANLVAYGIRADVFVSVGTAILNTDNALALSRQLRELILLTLAIQIFDKADQVDSWVDTTPLKYFARPDGKFLPIPALTMQERDPRMQLQVRPVDFGPSAPGNPTITPLVDSTVNVAVVVETLFAPDPAICGDHWPGSCNPLTIKGYSYDKREKLAARFPYAKLLGNQAAAYAKLA